MAEHYLDLKNKTLGRASSEIAKILLGKNKVNFSPNKVTDDIVIVNNLHKLKFDVKKLISKKYYRHSGKIGKLKEVNLKEKIEKNLPSFFRETVKKMLPNNKLRELRLKRLKFE